MSSTDDELLKRIYPLVGPWALSVFGVWHNIIATPTQHWEMRCGARFNRLTTIKDIQGLPLPARDSGRETTVCSVCRTHVAHAILKSYTERR